MRRLIISARFSSEATQPSGEPPEVGVGNAGREEIREPGRQFMGRQAPVLGRPGFGFHEIEEGGRAEHGFEAVFQSRPLADLLLTRREPVEKPADG